MTLLSQLTGSPDLSDKIVASCERAFADSAGDCGRFLNVVASQYFADGGFDEDDPNRIVERMSCAGSGWIHLGNDPLEAVKAAKRGLFVIAAMRSKEFQPARERGHLAIVVGRQGSRSGATLLPICYAGGRGGPAICGRRISGTFPMSAAESRTISYFARRPVIEPAESAFEILFGFSRNHGFERSDILLNAKSAQDSDI